MGHADWAPGRLSLCSLSSELTLRPYVSKQLCPHFPGPGSISAPPHRPVGTRPLPAPTMGASSLIRLLLHLRITAAENEGFQEGRLGM